MANPLPAPEIFDVTIRDGSYVVDFQFDQRDVAGLYTLIDRMGFRYIEVGHGFGLNASAVKGSAAASDDEYLAAAAAGCTTSKFGTFFIPGVGEKEHIHRARTAFGMHFIRIGNDPEKIDRIIPYVEYARELGLEVMANYMKTYAIRPAEMARTAKAVVAAGADTVYVVDSAGGMLPDEVAEYVRALREEVGCKVGFHGHNNLELAIANALAAWRAGCTMLDCSIGGLGRSSGNTRTELIIPVLQALGVSLPYDYLEVLRVWQQLIRPVMQRRRITAEDVVGGFAKVHSGLMGPFREAAAKFGVDETALLYGYGSAKLAGQSPTPASVAAELAAVPGATLPADPGFSLLAYGGSPPEPHMIRNTFHRAEEVVRAAGVLAHKAQLPVVLLVQIQPMADAEDSLVAEYAFHDDHFVVLRATCGGVPTFRSLMDRSRGVVNVVAFHGLTGPVRDELRASEAEWRQGETVVWVNPSAARIHHLRAVLQNLVARTGARSVFLFGPSPEQVAPHLAVWPHPDCRIYCTSRDEVARFGLRLVEAPGPRKDVRPDPVPSDARFDIGVLLAAVDDGELATLLDRMTPGGVVIDCTGQYTRDVPPFRGRPQQVLPLSLRRALTGELLNLLAAGAESSANVDSSASGGAHAVRLHAA
jgi:4-hydroxy-2-oxovalerate aldolase